MISTGRPSSLKGIKKGPLSIEIRNKISISNMGKIMSDEAKSKISKGNKNKPKSTDHILKIKASRLANKGYVRTKAANEKSTKTWHLNNDCKLQLKYLITYISTGETQIINSMKAFCKKFNLSEGSMYFVLKGKRKQHKGFHIQYYKD